MHNLQILMSPKKKAHIVNLTNSHPCGLARSLLELRGAWIVNITGSLSKEADIS